MAEINIEKIAQSVAKKTIQELRDNGVFVSKWIPVNEKLPKMKEQVLCCEKDKVFIGCMVFEYDGVPVFSKSNYKHFYVTAWMPLPKPYEPQESEAENG